MHNRLKMLRFNRTPLYWHDCCRDVHHCAGRFKAVRENRDNAKGGFKVLTNGGIQALGKGEGSPIADNASSEGRANSRRVEIIIELESYTSKQSYTFNR